MNESPILIISGTNRPGSNALRVARVIEGKYRSLDVKAEVYSLAELPPEIFRAESYAAKPDSFVPVQQRVLGARGLHIVTPEYNGSFPGVLKYFIDMLKFPESFERKPVAFVGEASGIWGALRAVEQLQMILGYRNAYAFPERVFIPGVRTQFGPDDSLVNVELDGRLARQAQGFAEFTEKLSQAR